MDRFKPRAEDTHGELAFSVVVPVYNEQDSVVPLCDQIRAACDPLGRPYEILLVDDGSSDRTPEILNDLARRDPRVRPIRFRKNYGQTAAMQAGFELSRGKVIVSMDGDLQNDPADIPRMLAKIDDGFDVVCGWRRRRQDKFLTRRVPSIIANWIIGRLTGVRIHDNGCSLKAYRASNIKSVKLYGEMHRFIPAMATLTDAKIAELVVNHRARRFGASKYGLGRVWRVILDIIVIKMITSFGSRPALWFGLWSMPFMLLGGFLLVAFAAFGVGGTPEAWLVGSTSAFLLFVLGANLLSLGIIGELVVKTGDHPVRPVTRTTVDFLEVENGENEHA